MAKFDLIRRLHYAACHGSLHCFCPTISLLVWPARLFPCWLRTVRINCLVDGRGQSCSHLCTWPRQSEGSALSLAATKKAGTMPTRTERKTKRSIWFLGSDREPTIKLAVRLRALLCLAIQERLYACSCLLCIRLNTASSWRAATTVLCVVVLKECMATVVKE